MRICPDCRASAFSTRDELRSHRRESHGFVTCTCNREFLKDEYMAQHRRESRKHGGKIKKQYPCKNCSRKFASSSSLTQHQRAKGHEKSVGVRRTLQNVTKGVGHHSVSQTTSRVSSLTSSSGASGFSPGFGTGLSLQNVTNAVGSLSFSQTTSRAAALVSSSGASGLVPFFGTERSLQDVTKGAGSLNVSQATSRVSSIASSSGASAPGPSDLYNLPKGSVDKFIDEEVQPDDSYIRSCKAVVGRLANFLQNNLPDELRPREVIKGGSLGKGTAVKGKSDIDLTLMMANLDNIEELMENMETVLGSLEEYLEDYGEVTVTGRTRHAVQVEVSCHESHTHSVDVLPAVDILPDLKVPRETLKTNLQPVWDLLGSKETETRSFLSVSVAPLQKALTRPLPTKLKSLIRLMKYWKKEKLAVVKGPKWPTSYVLELVTLSAWANAGKPQSFDMVRALHAVLTLLENHHQFRVIFDKDIAFYDEQLAETGEGPYIMDPCNPYNDVYHGHFGKAWAWKDVAEKASEWKSRPLFFGMFNPIGNWN